MDIGHRGRQFGTHKVNISSQKTVLKQTIFMVEVFVYFIPIPK